MSFPFLDFESSFFTNEELLFLAGASGGGVEYTIINNPATFTTDLAKPLRQLVIPFTPVQSGSGDPSPDNVRPITGWTGLNIYRTGKNVIDFNAQSRNGLTVTKAEGKATVTGTASAEAFPLNFVPVILPPGSYTWSVSGLKSGMTMEYAINGTWAGSVTTTATFTLSAQSRITGYVKANNGTETNTIVSVQLEPGATASEFAPYSGTTIPVSWQTEAGTVYGGALDALTGVLTVTHKIWTKNTNEMNRGSDIYPGWNQCGIKEFVGGNKDGAYSVIMNCGKVVGIVTEGSADNVYLAYSRYGLTEAEWKALALDVQIACELATPQTVQLDPVTLSTLIGDNVLWTDTNGDNTIVYLKKT